MRIEPSIQTEINEAIIEKWNDLLQSISDILDVPSALIMRVEGEVLRVFARSEHLQSPYQLGDGASLDENLYCKSVIETQETLHVPDARTDTRWDDNPDTKRGMISYLGFPINWPSGRSFGTVCILDVKVNLFSKAVMGLMKNIVSLIQQDLELVMNESRLIHQKKILEQFTSTLVHDLKNPIASLISSAELLQQPSDMDEIKEVAGLLSSSSERLYEMVSGMHAFFLGKSTELAEVRLNELVDDVAVDLRNQVSEKHAKIVSGKLDTVVGIQSMLYSVLLNLVSNSLKFSKQDVPPVIQISTEISEDSPSWTILKVSDNGIGIDPSEAEMLFENHYRSSHVDAISGTGIGLYTCRLFAEYLGGKIWAEGKLGEGTSIYFKLKLA